MSIIDARGIIDKAIKNKKANIDISGQDISEIPIELKEIKDLKRLNISDNAISELPNWISGFKDLEFLDARNNKLTDLPSDFTQLKKLITINLRNNHIRVVPKEFQKMPWVNFISLNYNEIEKIPAWFFDIEDVNIENNPIIDPPIEVYSRGTETIKNYFKEREKGTDNLYEAKLLIVGEPGAGKTTLMNKILDEKYKLDLFEASTKGIEIKPYKFNTKDKHNFRVNIWDFGGQEIYHATHQFFLTKRSLYILLSDNRTENTDFNYWLQTIELLSGNSPMIIVQNEKQNRKKDINFSGMKERFNNLKANYSFDLSKNIKGIKNLKSEIEHQICLLPHIGSELPKIWVGIRRTLEEEAIKQPYINESEYFLICEKHGMEGKDRMYFLSDYLHDLGVFLHFRDNAVLKRWIILRPDWATEAVYKILDNKGVVESNGYFTKSNLETIWRDSKYADMHDELISLMMKFELCYQMENSGTYIAPQLLRTAKPSYSWDSQNDITVKYDYEFMPKGIITRFIVRMFYYISDQSLVWREGVILRKNESVAEVVETYGKREIRIKVSGVYQREFLAIIMDSLDKLHLTYHNLKAEKLIPCNCSECKSSKDPYYFSFDTVRKYLANKISDDRCRKSLKSISLAPLLDSFTGYSKSAGLKIYISSSKEDFESKKDFLKHFKSIQRNYQIVITDSDDASPGFNEKEYVRDQLDTTDVIICLLSHHYIASDWHVDVELQKALDRTETASCLFIPVILSDCDWKSLPIGHIKPVQYNSKPLFFEETKKDSALLDAIMQIKNALDNYTKMKNI